MLLMFLAFGSVVLPIKAAVMSVLTLGSTMGILTWIFVDGHFAKQLNFTPTPLMVVIIALVVAVGYGLATDYEVFLVSRMVEARARGMSTAEAIRIGTATTGRLITAAALVLAVVAGSFMFSDLVMMKYLAFGLAAALLLDATVVRMFLVPSVMKLLGDDCWWAPRWARRLQNRLGLGEIDLPDEHKRPSGFGAGGRAVRPPVKAASLAAAAPRPAHDPTHPGPAPTRQSPGELPSGESTARLNTRPAQPDEESTTRLSVPGQPAPPPGPTRAVPVNGPASGENANDPADPTAALPVMRPEKGEVSDSEAATEKMNARGDNGDEPRPRRRGGGGGVSAADLLRREGRL